jgi:hypothetical protein
MPTWSSFDLARFLERGVRTQRVLDRFDKRPDDREASLHYFILEEVRARGWLCFHGSMAHRSRRTTGEPDFQILIPGGRLLLVECKTALGKCSDEQLARAAHARKLGHTIHVIRSQREFLHLIKTHEDQSPERL